MTPINKNKKRERRIKIFLNISVDFFGYSESRTRPWKLKSWICKFVSTKQVFCPLIKSKERKTSPQCSRNIYQYNSEQNSLIIIQIAEWEKILGTKYEDWTWTMILRKTAKLNKILIVYFLKQQNTICTLAKSTRLYIDQHTDTEFLLFVCKCELHKVNRDEFSG